MISRTSILAALFAVIATTSIAFAADHQVRRVDAAATASATAVAATVQLPTVYVTAKRAA
jgi:hypothetical protein